MQLVNQLRNQELLSVCRVCGIGVNQASTKRKQAARRDTAGVNQPVLRCDLSAGGPYRSNRLIQIWTGPGTENAMNTNHNLWLAFGVLTMAMCAYLKPEQQELRERKAAKKVQPQRARLPGKLTGLKWTLNRCYLITHGFEADSEP